MTARGVSDTWLSREEIADMCRAKKKTLQVKFLRDNGIRHYLDRRGWPVVSRAVADSVHGKGPAEAPLDQGWKSNKAA